ncbi:MAG: IS4 family transposase [Bryobacteraceae bacterium]
MRILVKVGAALQQLLGPFAQAAADECGVIKRKRKFSGLSLAQTFVLGFLQDPQASDEKLAQIAAQCGVEVTPQAIEQRHTEKLVDFLQRLFRAATQVVVGSDKALAPILERFTSVTLLDSSTIMLPDQEQEQFPGCGGSYGSGAAALKLQTELDLRSGALTHVGIESARSPDAATKRQHARRGPGSLRISDLGYFNVFVFAAMTAADEHFLSRLQFGTAVRPHDGHSVDLLPWLANQPGPLVDRPILLGQKQRLACRLIAWRLPREQANRRRQKLRQETMRKRGCEPCAERLAWCDWTILVTSVPGDMLTPKEATVLYRARWQVELLFKRWKSQGLVTELSGSTEVRQMVRVWARLLAAVVQHWLIIASVWGDPTKSLSKAFEAVRAFAGRIAAALTCLPELDRVLNDIGRTVAKTCKRNTRSRPGTFELLNDHDLLDFRLT